MGTFGADDARGDRVMCLSAVTPSDSIPEAGGDSDEANRGCGLSRNVWCIAKALDDEIAVMACGEDDGSPWSCSNAAW